MDKTGGGRETLIKDLKRHVVGCPLNGRSTLWLSASVLNALIMRRGPGTLPSPCRIHKKVSTNMGEGGVKAVPLDKDNDRDNGEGSSREMRGGVSSQRKSSGSLAHYVL